MAESWDFSDDADLGLGHVRIAGAQAGISPRAPGARYGEPAGWLALREAVAKWRGVDVSEVAITTGASLALVATLCTLDRPASVLVPRPHYSAYSRVPTLLGLDLVAHDLDGADGWQASSPRIERALRPDTRAMILNQPHNPTGGITGLPALRRIAEIAHANELLVVSDETYAGIVYDGASIPDPRAILAPASLVQILSFSKLFGMPGERVGCVIADPERLAAIIDAHWTLAMSPPATAQALALAALTSEPERHVDLLVRRLAANRERASEILSDCPQVRFAEPAGGCFFWLEIPACTLDSRTFVRRCREVAGVRLVPGYVCGVEAPLCVRVSFAVPPDELVEGLRRLIRFASEVAELDLPAPSRRRA